MRLESVSLIAGLLACLSCSPENDFFANVGGSATMGGKLSSGGRGGAAPAVTGGSTPTNSSGASTGGHSTGGSSTEMGGTASGGTLAPGGAAGSGSANADAAGSPASGGGPAGGGSAGSDSGGATAGSAGTAGGNGGATGGMILLEDNFDSSTVGGPPDSTKWMAPVVGDANQPTIDAARAHSPPNAAKITGSSTGNAFLIFTTGLPTANNRVYVRAYVNLAKASSAITGHVGFIVGATTRNNSGTELRFGSSTPPGFSGSMLDVNLQNPMDRGGEVTRFSNGYTTGGEPLNLAGNTLAANRWYCIEALFSGTPSEFNLWIDGAEVTALHITDFDSRGTMPRTMWAPSFKFLKFGAQNYGGDAGQLWYDDIVIGTQRIGCE
jgi:hypothetical protein